MKIFEKRPLALILCIMLGGFSFFADFDWFIKVIFATVSLLLIGIIFIFDNLKKGRNAITVICLSAFSITMLLSVWWSYTFYPTDHYGEDKEITAKIYSIDNSDSSTSVIVCDVLTIDGESCNHKFIAYTGKEVAVNLRQYDVVTFKAEIKEFSKIDDGFDGKSYYLSKGYSALCTSLSDVIVKYNEVDKVDSFLNGMRLKISNKLKLRTDFNTGALLSALIVGERVDLSGSIKLNFARLGISHILALSGMHLAILSLAVNALLTKLGINKKLRVTIISVLVLFYMGLTGFSPSVLRSGIMLIISGTLFLLASKSDGVTSLFISVSIIVLFDPVSIYDISLWLSAFATLGVIVFSEIAQESDESDSKLKKLWTSIKNACIVSVFAFSATFAFMALRFDSFSVASVFTTLIFSYIIQILIYGGLLLLLIGRIIPFGKIIIFISDAILLLAERISSVKWIYVSLDSYFVKLLIILMSVFFFSFIVLEIKNKRKGVIILLVLLVSVFSVAEARTLAKRYDDELVYTPGVCGDILLLKDSGDLTVVYSGKAFTDGAWDILDCFNEEAITYVDNLVFAGYAYSTVDFIHAIIDGIKVERIMLPKPTTDDEIGQSEGLSYLLSEYGTILEFYDTVEYIDFGNYRYRLFNKVDYTYGEYPENVFEIVTTDKRYTYLSVCDYKDLPVSARDLIWNSENLIIGTIGNSNYYLFDMRLSDIREIYYYDEGRLTDDACDHYKSIGASVVCTQESYRLID